MVLTAEEQDVKDLNIKREKEAFIALSRDVAGDLKDVFYNIQNLLVKWFQEGGADGFQDNYFLQGSVDKEDLVAFMVALQSISTAAQDPANQWVAIVSALAEARKL